MKKLPWSKFYWADWRNEMSLKACSLAARGFWMEMLAIMGISERYGYLQVGGQKITMKQLAIMAGCSEAEAIEHYEELNKMNVFSVSEDGVPYSRRMVKEQQMREDSEINGKLGGNPLLNNPPTSGEKLEAKRLEHGITQGVNPLDNLLCNFSDTFKALWNDWREDRKARKKKMTPKAEELQLAKCVKWGEAKAIESIKASIEGGWQGLFEPKEGIATVATLNGRPAPIANPMASWNNAFHGSLAQLQGAVDTQQYDKDSVKNCMSMLRDKYGRVVYEGKDAVDEAIKAFKSGAKQQLEGGF